MTYDIIFSSRKTLAIEITKDAKVLVRAPYRYPKNRIENFVSTHTDWIEKHLKRRLEKNSKSYEPTDEELALLKEKAKEIIPQKVQYYANLMGVEPSGIGYTYAKTRFGSCSIKRKLNFSCRLMLYPDEAIDYVVVHELAHIRHMNHSKSFWSFVEKTLPDYKERRKLLR